LFSKKTKFIMLAQYLLVLFAQSFLLTHAAFHFSSNPISKPLIPRLCRDSRDPKCVKNLGMIFWKNGLDLDQDSEYVSLALYDRAVTRFAQSKAGSREDRASMIEAKLKHIGRAASVHNSKGKVYVSSSKFAEGMATLSIDYRQITFADVKHAFKEVKNSWNEKGVCSTQQQKQVKTPVKNPKKRLFKRGFNQNGQFVRGSYNPAVYPLYNGGSYYYASYYEGPQQSTSNKNTDTFKPYNYGQKKTSCQEVNQQFSSAQNSLDQMEHHHSTPQKRPGTRVWTFVKGAFKAILTAIAVVVLAVGYLFYYSFWFILIIIMALCGAGF
jgi:hypothetical protein